MDSVPYRIFDIEIAKTIEETPGGWDGARKGLAGLSCAVVYDSETKQTWLYGPQDVEGLASALEAPVVAISYNGIGFDVPAIEGMIGRKLDVRTHFDLLDALVTAVGSRRGLTLENVSRHTLGRGKSGSGAMAPEMYKTALKGGEEGAETMVKLLQYCGMDCILVRDLINFVQDHGFVVGPNGPIHLTLPTFFSQLQRG